MEQLSLHYSFKSIKIENERQIHILKPINIIHFNHQTLLNNKLSSFRPTMNIKPLPQICFKN